MIQTRPIIVFDSGIGGLSIYRPLKASLPDVAIIYLSDPNNFPYGDKSESWLTERFRVLAHEFQSYNPRLVVLACNTATTNVITELRANLKCKVVGVEPVIKPLAKYQRSLALMTEAAADSAQTKHLLQSYGDYVTVFTPRGLAEAIEFNNIDQMKISIHEINQIVQKQNIQAIGLSCTHYPLILNEFKKVIKNVDFIDPAEAIVAQVGRMLESNGI